MTKPVKYDIYSEDGKHSITITPVNEPEPPGGPHVTGVFNLSEGHTDMGDIVFDDQMRQWEYTAMGNLTHAEAEEIADFIRNYDDTSNKG